MSSVAAFLFRLFIRAPGCSSVDRTRRLHPPPLRRRRPSLSGKRLWGAMSVAAVSALAGCGGPSTMAPGVSPDHRLPGDTPGEPPIYFQSYRNPFALAECLADRLDRTRIVPGTNGAQLYVDRGVWVLDISENGNGGAIVAGHRGSGGAEIEPAIRVAVARCSL